MIVPLALLALQTLPSPTLDRWETTGSDNRGESAIDPQSMIRSGDRVTAIVRTRIHRSASTGQPVVGVMRYSFNCRTNFARMESADIYNGDGGFVGSTGNDGPEEAVAPESPNAAALARVCRR